MKDLTENIPQATKGVLIGIPNPAKLLAVDTESYDPMKGIQAKIEYYRMTFKEKYPNLSEDQLRYVLNVVFGPFNLGKRILNPRLEGGGGLSREEKTYSAKAQHMLTHLALFAGSRTADTEIQKKVLAQLAQYQAITKTKFGREIELGNFWSGVKSEVAVCKALIAGGAEVILPNYQPQSDGETFEDSEVCKWDVDRGIDLVAVKNGHIFLIDAKGTAFIKEQGTGKELVGKDGTKMVRDRVDMIEGQHYEWNIQSLRNIDGLQEIFATHPQSTVHRMTIKVPTMDEYMTPVVVADNISPDRSLRAFARLKANLVNDIIIGLDQSSQAKLGKTMYDAGEYGQQVA